MELEFCKTCSDHHFNNFVCSECGERFSSVWPCINIDNKRPYKFCPNCGHEFDRESAMEKWKIWRQEKAAAKEAASMPDQTKPNPFRRIPASIQALDRVLAGGYPHDQMQRDISQARATLVALKEIEQEQEENNG
jgi:DNA-directed RNA polymerase subunit RPC12/RpoP